jgi:hypothetical protein
MRGATIRPLSSLLIDSGRASMVSMRTVANGASSSALVDLSHALSVNASAQAEPGKQMFRHE